jgi:hypothetical protein
MKPKLENQFVNVLFALIVVLPAALILLANFAK